MFNIGEAKEFSTRQTPGFQLKWYYCLQLEGGVDTGLPMENDNQDSL